MDFPLEEQNGRLGYKKKGRFYDISNFTMRPKGQITNFTPSGILWTCDFPDSGRTQDIYVPYCDLDNRVKFKAHMNGQFADYVYLKCSDSVWARAMNSYMQNFNSRDHQIHMVETLGFQRSVYKRGEIGTVKFVLSRNTFLDGTGQLDPAPTSFMFPWRDDKSSGSISYNKKSKFVDIPYLEGGREVMAQCFEHITLNNEWQFVLTMASALSCIYGLPWSAGWLPPGR